MIESLDDVRRTYIKDSHMFDDLKSPEDFFAWLRADNMHIVIAFQHAAILLRDGGNRKRYGAFAIINKLRWDSYFSENGTDYKISNDTAPYLARLVMSANPELEGMFITKSQVKNHG